MPKRALQFHKTDPYKRARIESQIVVYSPSGYQLALLVSLPAVALRTLLILAANIEPDGSVMMPLATLAKGLNTTQPFANRGILWLARFDIIAKSGPGRYWLNGALFRPLALKDM